MGRAACGGCTGGMRMRDRVEDDDLEPARPTLLPRVVNPEGDPPPQSRTVYAWRRTVPSTRTFPRGGARGGE
jgi:hypothetical protein